ncbi:dihydrolipoamide acetyltransferase component of pyruvate dehydrogenase complex [Nocardioides szechwanensis]|uniref:Dihydrolipoamide acetyltransferase component of pyruvate dehydrogenase complex n=1 Tax=Nocardioides szechwanensis TaxID=1005944 RepID=A0A1H0EBW1_9ACTN|nr:dihydrolipoamide acetyltransferase family protein [Nocardioides szechwanensis]GEP34720.1 dihydrolipoamide acetyltransferase component of pyruvate dehydrogenase complex [Nocardioides szechwanensis]SDN79786.1 pyruvate dehydrogenase E2 component (dihydrolipoamide acetyltransferase) [Nocardioides szechwanensis]
MPEYLLPDVGEGLIEAEIVTWKVKVGDVVAINDIVVEIETAKSLVELPSPYEGEVTALLAAEGDTVAVGTPIIAIGAPAEVPAEMEIDLSNPAASGRVEGESLVGRNKAERGPQRRARKGSASPSTVAGASAQMQLQGAFAPGGALSDDVVADDEPAVPATPARPHATAERGAPKSLHALAKPPVRKLAKELGVDLAALVGTGPQGSVTRADLEAAAGANGDGVSRPLAGARGTSTTVERETREPIKGVRKMMATAMVGSAFSAPHVTEWVTVDVTRTMDFVDRLKKRREFRDVKVSPLLVLARAVALAVRRTPEVNSFWDEAAQEVVLKHYVNLGIAAATPRGLVVPNVKDAQDLTLLELAGALNALTATAREGKTQPAEMSGGTFTITNVGVFGVDAGTPIINPGESAILCFGAIKKQPWVVTTDGVDEIVPRQVTTLALSFDHRHVDGEKGSRFLADVAGILEDPASALLF